MTIQDSRLSSSCEPPDDTSSFQMNPLSSQPPRTPRTSIMSNGSHAFGSDAYEAKDDREITSQTSEVEDSEDEDEATQDAAKDRVRREDVWREMLKTAYGRDKTFVRPPFILCSCASRAVLLCLLAAKCPTDRALRTTETAAVLDEGVPSFPCGSHGEPCVPRADTACMGGGAHATFDLCHRWVFIDEVSAMYREVACMH